MVVYSTKKSRWSYTQCISLCLHGSEIFSQIHIELTLSVGNCGLKCYKHIEILKNLYGNENIFTLIWYKAHTTTSLSNIDIYRNGRNTFLSNGMFYGSCKFLSVLIFCHRDITRTLLSLTSMIEISAKTFGRKPWRTMRFFDVRPRYVVNEKSIIYSAEDLHLGDNILKI